MSILRPNMAVPLRLPFCSFLRDGLNNNNDDNDNNYKTGRDWPFARWRPFTTNDQNPFRLSFHM